MLPWQQTSEERDQNTKREKPTQNNSSSHTILIFVHHFDFKKIVTLELTQKVMIQREIGPILIQWVIKYKKNESACYTDDVYMTTHTPRPLKSQHSVI